MCGGPLSTPGEKVIGRHEDCPSGADEEIFETLRAWRAEASREAGVPAYIVFSDATLMALAEALPADRNELLDVPGVGPVKVERYGVQLLAVIDAFR